MKILMISGSPFMGGAEIAARRIAEGLRTIGCEVFFITTCNQEIPHAYFSKIDFPYDGVKGKILKQIKYISYPLAYAWNTRYASFFFNKIISEIKPDIINIHNIKQAFWGPEIVGLCAESAPTVWTLHDMSSFTGRCVHALDCDGYETNCGKKCKSRHIPFIIPRSLTYKRWKTNKAVIQSHRSLVAVCPSEWLSNKAKNAFWIRNRVETIANGLDLSHFFPIPMETARKKLHLPQDELLFLIVAMEMNSPLKGGIFLNEAIKLLKNKNFSLVAVGSEKKNVWKETKVEIHRLGYMEPHMMPLVYSAVNLIIHPSLADTLPNVIIEAMACGTPTVGFRIGGIPEIIQNGINGLIIDEISPLSLANALDHIQQEHSILNHNIQEKCREMAEKKYDYLKQAKKYFTLFSSMNNIGIL